MLEIILVIYLSKKIGKMVEAKGQKKGWYVFMFVMLWIIGEFVGAIIGGLIAEGPLIYLFAILGAGLGALISFGIVYGICSTELSEPE